MTETNKNANRSFLEKFQGRTKKVSKQGVHALLTSLSPTQLPQQFPQSHQSHQLRKADLDSQLPTNPQQIKQKQITQNISSLRRDSLNRPPLKSTQKKTYIPSAYTPQTKSKDEESFGGIGNPPSRSVSNGNSSNSNTNNSKRKYVFGKYLKLDKEAMGHMQFMAYVEEKSFFRRNSQFNDNLQ